MDKKKRELLHEQEMNEINNMLFFLLFFLRRSENDHASASAYQDINRTLGNFYEAPREDPEKEVR